MLYRTYWERLQPLPGARELVAACADRGVVVLASSAKPDDLAEMRRVLDCDDYITAATSAADVSASKPHPDLIGAALEAARLQAAGSVFVGDAVWDVEAAGRADVACIGVASGIFSQQELADAGALRPMPMPAISWRISPRARSAESSADHDDVGLRRTPEVGYWAGSHVSAYPLCALSPLLVYCNYAQSH